MHCDYSFPFFACSPTSIILIYELVSLFLETVMESTVFMESTVPELVSVFGIIVSLSVARSTLAFHNT